MGIRGLRTGCILTEKEITDRFCYEYLGIEHSSDRVFPNVFYKNYECDLLKLTKAGFTYEYEVKISKSDLKADALKKQKYIKEAGVWEINQLTKHESLLAGKRVNYFSYIVPQGIVDVDEIPEWVGLIYVEKYEFEGKSYVRLNNVRKPRRLSSDKATAEDIERLYNSIYYRFHKLRLKLDNDGKM